MAGALTLRAATADDAPALAAIYGWHVVHGLGTFEETPPPAEEIAARLTRVVAADYPYLVAERDGALEGYAYASAFRDRSAYRFTAEDSVYVAPGCEGRGVGRALLTALLDACAAQGFQRMLAAIGDSGNTASIRLHAALGFHHAGVLHSVGYKHNRWVDVVLMQRGLGQRSLTT